MDRWRNHINQILNEGGLQIVFQPICTLTDPPRTVGYESLSRFPIRDDIPLSEQRPDIWFTRAHELGFGSELEIAAASCAVEAIPLVDPLYVSINVSAETMVMRPFATMILGTLASNVVVELTEHDAVENYEELLSVLADIRGVRRPRLGIKEPDDGELARLAIDDVGQGHSGLYRIITLSPDILKLDRALVANVDNDRLKASMVAGLVIFAAAAGIVLVAEGIETRGEFDALAALGVDCGQGYLLGRPEPMDGVGKCRPLT